jgi:hypothetical protein
VTAHTPQALDLLGWSVYEHNPANNPAPRGGTIYDVVEAPDPETGELVTIYRTVAIWRHELRLCSLRSDQCQEPEPPNMAVLRPLVKAICGEVKDAPGWGDGHRSLIATAHRLAGVTW